MKKKIIIGLTVLLLLVAAGIYLAGKESWKEEMELFGPLNVMQQDAHLTTNDGDAVYTVSRKKDIQISNEFHIYKGTVSLTIYLNGDQIYQKNMQEGDYVFDLDPMMNTKGDIRVVYTAPDDVDGSYSISIKTRVRRWNRILHNIKKNF